MLFKSNCFPLKSSLSCLWKTGAEKTCIMHHHARGRRALSIARPRWRPAAERTRGVQSAYMTPVRCNDRRCSSARHWLRVGAKGSLRLVLAIELTRMQNWLKCGDLAFVQVTNFLRLFTASSFEHPQRLFAAFATSDCERERAERELDVSER